MPSSHRHPASQTPASPTTKSTAKYTNKDGSKFITVPKGTASAEPSQPSTPTTASKAPAAQSTAAPNAGNDPAPTVNRKKQKRRQKALQKAAAEQGGNPANGRLSPTAADADATYHGSQQFAEDEPSDEEPEAYLQRHQGRPDTNGTPPQEAMPNKKSKKKKKKNANPANNRDASLDSALDPSSQIPAPRSSGISKEKIWNTSSQEERERIKEFWLGLGEDDRKSLVKVEKDAVLKKMKEQQKHTCSCTVCGRKRTAIEDELENLYESYYRELEEFANNGEGPPMLGPSREFPLRPPRGLPSSYSGQRPSRGRIIGTIGDDDDDDVDEVYSGDDAEEDDYSDDDGAEDIHSSHERDMADFLTFGNSLQVKGMKLPASNIVIGIINSAFRPGGILTVADDLLKNDGKRFIEMMEQLAERRMAREEDAREHFRSYAHGVNGSYPVPHHQPPDDEEYDDEEEDEEDYDDSQDDDYEDDEVVSSKKAKRRKAINKCKYQDTMTDEQRMEEGRRMFQIFAARMFEQRVLTAYREKVAKERQQKLIEELEEESRQDSQRKAKKAKDAQKRKDKAAQKKQALAEEKAKKDAEKAAEEAARLAEEEKRAEEQRLKADEKRRKKEAQRKAEEDERIRKESERQRKAQEQQEKRVEQARKLREAKEKEKKLKDEQRQKDKEVREQKELESRERKERTEREKRDREAKTKMEKEAAKEVRERHKHDDKVMAQKPLALTPSIPPTQPGKKQHQITIPAVLPQHPPNPNPVAQYISPKIQVATPAIPKAPTPIRPRRTSQQQEASSMASQPSQSGSGPSQNPSPHPATPTHTSPVPVAPIGKATVNASSGIAPNSHSASPSSVTDRTLPAGQPGPFHMPPTALPFPPGIPQGPPPGFQNPMGHNPVFPPMAGAFRPMPGMMGMPPGLNGPAGRGFPMPHPPPGFGQPTGDQMPNISQGFPIPNDGTTSSHSRQPSGGFDAGSPALAGMPISRPAPIRRPGSVVHGQRAGDFPSRLFEDSEDLHLGSSALLHDSEAAGEIEAQARRLDPPGPRGFPHSQFMTPGFPMGTDPWGASPVVPGMPFGAPPGLGHPTWGSLPTRPPPVPVVPFRTDINPRSVTIRRMLCNACQTLQQNSTDKSGYVDLVAVKDEVDRMNRPSPNENIPNRQLGDIPFTELLDLCDTEGNGNNGGGNFDVQKLGENHGGVKIRWVTDGDQPMLLQRHSRPVGASRELGSPIIGSSGL
jgi:hypothetical protein